MDERYAEISLQVCPLCEQLWLRYHYELEYISRSGRWYLGAVTQAQAKEVTVQNAQSILEGLSWYFYGGSYFGGKSGRTSGVLDL